MLGKNKTKCHICRREKECKSQILIEQFDFKGVIIKPLAIRLCDECTKWLRDMLDILVKRQGA